MTSAYAIATLVVFVISIFFVLRPINIPTPRPIPQIPINLTTAPILAIAVLWAAQCLDPAVIRNGIVGTEGVKSYNILILFFSLAYMAITLDITGILEAAAYWVSNKGGHNGWKLYLYFYLMLSFLSILLGNDPVIITGTAFLVHYTQASRLDWRAWIMAEFAAANIASMVLFTGNPTNVVICEGFGVNNATFTAYTILPFLACNLSCFVVMALQYRNDVRPKLTRTIHHDPWLALSDPFGALVGSFMLCAMLILCLVASLLGIDVWMISLPFALGKFLFDLGWDHYRYSRGISMLRRGPPKHVEKTVCTQRSRIPDEEQPRSSLPDGAIAVLSHFEIPETKPKTESQPLPTRTAGDKLLSNEVDERQFVDTAAPTTSPPKAAVVRSRSKTPDIGPKVETQPPPTQKAETKMMNLLQMYRSSLEDLYDQLDRHFPTVINALPRLPFSLVPFAFCQFILVEALNHQGWVNVFASWLVRASVNQLHWTIWVVGVLGVVLSNLSGTNIGATIFLTKVIRAAALPYDSNRGAAIALAVVSNIGAVNFTFSASLAGLLWRDILGQKGIHMGQRDFALRNLLPLFAVTTVGLGTVSAEMAVLFQS